MDTSFLGQILKDYGLYTTVFVIAILYVLKDLWNKFADKFFGMSHTIALKNHSVFKEFDRCIEHIIANEFVCECPIRKAIYRDILIEIFKCFRNRLYEFVQTDLDSKELYPTQHDFYVKVVEVLNEARSEARKNSIANGVPEFILERMEEVQRQYISVFHDLLKQHCHTEYFNRTNTMRMSDVLQTVWTFFKNYKDTLELILDSYNGEIKNLEYHGIKCNNCRVCIHDEYVKRKKSSLSK